MHRDLIAIVVEGDLNKERIETWLPRSRYQLAGMVSSGIAALVTNSLNLAAATRCQDRQLAIIFVPDGSSEDLAIAALRCGCTDYVTPLSRETFLAALERCQECRPPPADPSQFVEGETLIGSSRAIRWLRETILKVARAPSNVLITGETGTGKELVARLIHQNSVRREHPMAAINCAAVPDALFESELFGYERGAFTGATIARDGKLRAANHGTVFLDEVGDMSLSAQAKILRAVENRQIERLGGSRPVPIDIRLVAATNRNLESLMSESRFRQDLFFRLNVARIELPPLREHKEDLPILIAALICEMNTKFQRQVTAMDRGALSRLFEHDWPGNVRELRNVIEAAFIDLPLTHHAVLPLPTGFRAATGISAMTEEERMLHALDVTHWNKSEAARELQWSRMTLYRKMAKYHVVPMAPIAPKKPTDRATSIAVTAGTRRVTAGS